MSEEFAESNKWEEESQLGMVPQIHTKTGVSLVWLSISRGLDRQLDQLRFLCGRESTLQFLEAFEVSLQQTMGRQL